MSAVKRKVGRAVLIVGEGLGDKAFLSHIKNCFDGRSTGQRITLQAADGGSPKSVIESTIRKNRHLKFDDIFILLDSDLTVRQQDYDRAKNQGVQILLSEPLCLEGMLLSVLGLQVGISSAACKASLHSRLSGSPTTARSYSGLFPADVLDAAENETVQRLLAIVRNQH